MRYIRFKSAFLVGLLFSFVVTSAMPLSNASADTVDPEKTCPNGGTYNKSMDKCGTATPGPSGTAQFKSTGDPKLTCPSTHELKDDKKCHSKQASDSAKADETYQRLGGSVDKFKEAYLKKYPDKSEEDFKAVTQKCWSDARKNSAGAGHYDPNADVSETTKKLFADCMSQETGVSKEESQTAVSGVDVGYVNEGSQAANQKSCEESGGKWENETCKQPTEEAEEEKSCGTEAKGIGWFMCPVLDGIITVVDGSWSLFESLLRTQPLSTTDSVTNGPSAVYLTWSNIRNLANGLLVVFFLIIVFSQITSMGLNNYGIKKALPKLIIMAVLINISFFIMQIAFDVANILGSTLADLISGSVQGISPNGGALVADIVTAGLTTTGAVVGGVAIAVGFGISAYPALIFLFIMLIPAIIAFFAGLVAMIIRLGLVEVLAVLAPIALVAYILPNTQSLFDKWRKTMFGLLMLYPTASIYYGALKMTAYIFLSNSEAEDTLYRLIGFMMLLFGSGVVAWLAIKSNAITGKIAGAVQGALDKAAAPVRTGLGVTASSMRKENMANMLHGEKKSGLSGFVQRRARSFDQKKRARELRSGIYNMAGQRQYEDSVLNNPSILGELGDTVEGQAVLQSHRKDAIARASAQFRNVSSAKELGGQLQQAIADNDSIKAQAVQGILATSKGSSGIEELNNSLIAAQNSGILKHGSFMDQSLRADLRDNHGAILGKDWGLKYWANDIKGAETIEEARDAATRGAILGVNEEGLKTGGMENRELTNMTKYAQERLFQVAQRDSNNNILRDAKGNVMTSSVDPQQILTKGQIESISTPAGESAEALPGPLLEKLQANSAPKLNMEPSNVKTAIRNQARAQQGKSRVSKGNRANIRSRRR